LGPSSNFALPTQQIAVGSGIASSGAQQLVGHVLAGQRITIGKIGIADSEPLRPTLVALCCEPGRNLVAIFGGGSIELLPPAHDCPELTDEQLTSYEAALLAFERGDWPLALKQLRAAPNHNGKTFNQFYGSNTQAKGKGAAANALGRCVSQHAKQSSQSQSNAITAAAKQCKASLKADAKAFALAYGSKPNAFGKCVSKLTKTS